MSFHNDMKTIEDFNDVSFACAIRQAYYSAITDYVIFRESPTGKGGADMVFVPVPGSVFPPIVVELKYDKSVEGAIAHIRRKEYPKGAPTLLA